MQYDLVTIQECPAGGHIKLSASDSKVYTIGATTIQCTERICPILLEVHFDLNGRDTIVAVIPATTKVLLLSNYPPKDDSVDLTEDENELIVGSSQMLFNLTDKARFRLSNKDQHYKSSGLFSSELQRTKDHCYIDDNTGKIQIAVKRPGTNESPTWLPANTQVILLQQ